MIANQSSPLAASAAVRPLHQPRKPPWRTLTIISILLVIVGVIAFFVGLHEGAQSRVWEAYLVNLLFFLGIAQSGIVIACGFYLTQARWAGEAQYRLAEAFFGFLPIGLILFFGLYFGRDYIFPWVLHPISNKAAWLNVPFLFARDGLVLLVMALLSWWFVHSSRRTDVRNWIANVETINLPPAIMRRLSPTVCICFVAGYSLLGFDLLMSLSPRWTDSLFGGFFTASCIWCGLVTIAFTAIMFRKALEPANQFSDRKILHDLGKLVFAFAIFWIYLLFSQYLVIWYGDIPIETFFVVVRVYYLPWATWAWVAFALIFCVPFLVLLGVKAKRSPVILGAVALWGMIGIWLLYYVLAVPSLSPHTVPYGWLEFFVTAGFVGGFTLCSIPGLKRLTAAMVGEQIPEEL